ncbi:hypothetical protein FOL47_009424 [Perkinsus chesapeaki]|uniref:Uncharacterized protein n=1 Tax=Perkinsus chesapeaki TaxID=330153 RepID=A0A7J6L8A3_PERCH|nr:hypothetical protein FOL47_009424 [Perkinsus chesapeaki]
MTKLTVERLEVAGESKRLETEATMEKCYWARGISALKEHKTAIQKRKTLERIRREIIVDGDRQSMRATFDLWHLVARRGARLSSIRRSGANRTVRTVVAAWRAETR